MYPIVRDYKAESHDLIFVISIYDPYHPGYPCFFKVVSYSYGEGGEWAAHGYLITIDHQLPDGSQVYSLYGHLSVKSCCALKEEGA